MRKITILLVLLFIGFQYEINAQDLPSPASFIGEEYGEQFTPHHKLVSYFQKISSDSRVELQKYGETNEGRPLFLAIVTSEENHRNLETIRKKNLSLAQMGSSTLSDEKALPIVWLSYSVHGNEAGGSESSMNVIHKLLTDENLKNLLNEVIVIIDPSLNPDGYSRYSHWVRGNSGKNLHPSHTDVEHMEPWPGGRVNHYLFDLNRDWAWQTQIETQQRVKQYNKWMPHIHADLHEMGYDNHYFFAPAAEPFHKAITDYQRELQYEIGQSNANVFDKNSWLYFTREVFDLLYPSYGDTYPTFNGAVGMTYEQAGHGKAGRSIQMSNNKNLTLQDRIDHHSATSISTIKTAIRERESIISNFKKYFENSVSSNGKKYKGYLIKSGVTSLQFAELMDANGIKYDIAQSDQSSSGYSYFEKRKTNFQVEKGDIYIPSAQPKAVLLDVLMEEAPELADSVTYDITSWCLPFAYGLETYALSTDLKLENNKVVESKSNPKISNNSYALYFKWASDMESKRVLSKLLSKRNIIIKRVNSDIKLKDANLVAGDILILKGDQLDKSYYEMAISIVKEIPSQNFGFIGSGFALSGSDLGGSGLSKIESPKVLTIFGDRVNANAYGQVWNYFENIIEYPISRVDINRLNAVELSEFNTIILPDGYYSLSENLRNSLRDWVAEGGKLISIGGANRNFNKDQNFAIGKVDKVESPKSNSNEEAELRYKKRKYEGAERRSISGSIPGAIFETEIDPSHPVCYGMKKYYTLKNSSMEYPLLGDNSYNPIRIPKDYNSYGFIGSKIQDRFNNSAVVSVENMGGGHVVYMADNPLFRAFWKSGEVLFANVIFQL